ncbi:tuberin isoform X2 [Orussus abietinus]|uniref:tuberin isoform X2 n=1 Tax=Orussus abietinus TaxID=222816 RepID=UPI000626378A|nr:tuberin isoform X2 [Orussus abietinus]
MLFEDRRSYQCRCSQLLQDLTCRPRVLQRCVKQYSYRYINRHDTHPGSDKMSKMSSKDKDNKTLHDKLKQFFRINKGNYKSREDFTLTHDIEKEISSESPVYHRTKAIKDLCDAVLNHQWEDRAAEKLWNLVQDLLGREVLKEHRHVTLNFLRCLVQGQYTKLSSLMRVKFFMVVKEHEIPEDIGPRLELLQSLTENGKDIQHLEERIGPFLLDWMPIVTGGDGKRGAEFLSLLVNVIKFNSAYIDEDVISGLVQYICHLCYFSNSTDVVSGCLEVLDAIVCYSNLQSDSLQTFIIALCRSVNVETYCQISWKIMRNLLGTHMGHSALYTMCRLLQDSNFQRDTGLLRGAVFYVNMGLWGSQRISKLECTPTSVLPSFYHVLQCNHPIVMYEVTLSIQRLVNKYGVELQEPTWSIILDIIDEVIAHTETSNQPATKQVSISLHETINSIESLLDSEHYNGCVQRFYELVERCSDSRPESSVLKLIDYRAGMIGPTRHQWQSKLATLMERYYKNETRTNVRVKALDVLTNVIQINRSRHEDELIERIVVPYLQHVDADPDITIRNVAAYLLVDLCLECETKRCLELLDILEKMVNKPFASDTAISVDSDIKDVKTAVVGTINILTTKMYRLPSSHAIRAYKVLVNHLEQHYKDPSILHDVSTIRHLIFECFLKIRANALYHIGFPDAGMSSVTRFSPYLVLDHGPSERLGGGGGGGSSPPPASPAPLQHVSCQVTHMSLAHACKAVITCIKQEKDWKVLSLILKEMPQVMQNRALILSRHSNDVDLLASALCSMVSDKSLRLPESLYNVPPKFTPSEFRVHVFPVLASLASYHAHLEPNLQQRLIKCLEVGLTARCASQCVTSLTTCTLEMRDAMNKLLSEVLLNLSKISATVHLAIPILEFLSTLTRLPKVFASFIGDQYMSVFAILLPYTNPYKYNHYTVSLAHHVIAVWFLKCRLPFRRNFVRFITHGLKANVIVPFKEGYLMKQDFGIVNEDSSSRKRSSSLTEQGSRGRRDRQMMTNRMIGEGRPLDLKPRMDEALMNFHIELTETCIDLMARYTFCTYSALPRRLPAADFLLKEGQSMTWLLGNRLITVTTSGCSNKAMRSGLCDNCWSACKAGPPSPEHLKPSQPNLRRTSSAEGPKEESKLSRQSSTANTAANSPTEEAKRVPEDADVLRRDYPQDKGDKDPPAEPSKLEQILGSEKQEEHEPCACWCQGWAEIYVRRPTGDMSWIMRIQNSMQFETPQDFPVHDITALYMPAPYSSPNRSQEGPSEFSGDDTELAMTKCRVSFQDVPETNPEHSQTEQPTYSTKSGTSSSVSSGPIAIPGSPARPSPSRQNSRDSLESLEEGEEDFPADSRRSRNPVRRSNSSPEMSANWKNPFLNKEKLNLQVDQEPLPSESEGKLDADLKKHAKTAYSKDMRVSCEAIPEEISGMGTTPPSSEHPGEHPGALRSQRSYPGASQTTQTSSTGTSNTVPASPTAAHAPGSFLGVQNRGVSSQTAAKPPQSPTQIYSRLSTGDPSQKQTSNVESKPPIGRNLLAEKTLQKDEKPDPASLPPLLFRDRGHTISVMSPVKKSRSEWDNIRRGTSPRVKDLPRTGINPSFVFLQLYHTAHFDTTTEKPLLVTQTTAVQRAVKVLDKIPPYETHKIGVIYVGPGQASNEVEILSNQHGSLRYTEFLQRLGTLIRLKDVDPQSVFLGGLDRNGENGNFAYIWQDDVMQVIFHVATLMPTKESDPQCTGKKLHIGNNYVHIVYNESGEPYNIQTVKGQFNYACVVIQPLDHGTNQVIVQAKEELAKHIGHSEPKIISDQNLAILARQLALHANLASMVSSSLEQKAHNPYASNWLERLRHIKRLRSKVLQDSVNNNSDGPSDELSPRSNKQDLDDFTEYTT